MDNDFNVERFLEITFDIMEKVAMDLGPIKEQIIKKYPESSYERLNHYRESFRKVLSKYQSEIYEKYGISLSEYNENATIYKSIIDNYLSEKDEIRGRYCSILNKMRLEPEKIKCDEEYHFKTSKPSRYPGGIDHF